MLLERRSIAELEELLAEYPGTLLIVSHDRTFLDNVVTQSIVALGDGRWREYAGGWADVEAAQRRETTQQREDTAKREATETAARRSAADTPRAGDDTTPSPARAKLSYKEQRELEALPARIESLEAEQKALEARLADPASYQAGGDAVRELRERFDAIEIELLEALESWEALESRKAPEGRAAGRT